MSTQIARNEAIRLAVAELENVDFATRCALLDLPVPDHGILSLRMFGTDFLFRQSDFDLIRAGNGDPAAPNDRILVLHYLLCDSPIVPTHELISFRGLPGGQFYWQPFLSRTVGPLIGRIGNNVELLREHLDRFDWQPVDMGDFGARIHAIGKLSVTLVYHRGDNEFPPAMDVLFDACIRQLFVTEDTAVLASRICLGLL